MSTPEVPDLTVLLAASAAGDAGAQDRLFAAVYEELRGISGQLMTRERPGHTLQPTALVNEAFLKLFDNKTLAAVPNRAYFFAAATRAMREILVEHARARAAAKRGAGRERVPLDNDVLDHLEAQHIDAADLRDALEKLELVSPQQARVVTLKFLFGYTIPEVAERLEISESTVQGDWRFAKAWLRDKLG